METHFQSKFLFSFVAVLILVGAFFLFNLKNPKNNITPLTQINATITEVKDNSVMVKGIVKSSSLSSSSTEKIIEVMITPDTKLQKNVYVVPKNMKLGVTFTPETKLTTITIKDLFVGMKIDLKTNKDILSSNKLTAVSILYENIEYKK